MKPADPLDGEIRSILTRLIGHAPDAPPLTDGQPLGPTQRRHRVRRAALAAAAVAVAVVGSVVAMNGSSSDQDLESAQPGSRSESVALSLPAMGVSMRLPPGWRQTEVDGVESFRGPDDVELVPDWTSDESGEGRAVETPVGGAHLVDVEGGLRLRVDIPCTWPACRRLDVFAYGLGTDTAGEERLLELVEGLTVSGPRLEGTLDDGRSWSLRQDFERGLCVEIDAAMFGCDESGPVVDRTEPVSTPRVAVEIVDLPEDRVGNLVYGFLPDPPLRPTSAPLVRLDYPDGRERTDNIVSDARTGLWAAPVTPGDLPESVAYLDEDGQVIEIRTIAPIDGDHEREAVVYAFGDKFTVEHYDDMTPVTVWVDSRLGRSEFLTAVLSASTDVEGNVQPAFASSAVPAVSVDGSVVVLDWDSEAASGELAIWSTSSGSTGLNLVLGMVFDNDPAVEVVEMRMDGSCELFTVTMQGDGCQTFSRERWTQFRTG